MLNNQLLELAKRIKSIAEIGLVYQENPYDIERYKELTDIGVELISLITNHPVEPIQDALAPTGQYLTPNVDVRAVIFNEKDEILLVKEVIDGNWSLPGGWSDIGYTPAETAIKETREEAGILVEANRLLAVMDKRCHPHPPDVYYTYKLYIECSMVGNTEKGHETEAVGFFGLDSLPPLSTPRITESQLRILYDRYKDPVASAYFD